MEPISPSHGFTQQPHNPTYLDTKMSLLSTQSHNKQIIYFFLNLRFWLDGPWLNLAPHPPALPMEICFWDTLDTSDLSCIDFQCSRNVASLTWCSGQGVAASMLVCKFNLSPGLGEDCKFEKW